MDSSMLAHQPQRVCQAEGHLLQPGGAAGGNPKVPQMRRQGNQGGEDYDHDLEESEMSSILVIAAHPDDEALGCGGTIARRAVEGHDIHVLIMAEGAMSRGANWQDYKNKLKLQAEKVRSALSPTPEICQERGAVGAIHPYNFADFADQKMDTVPLLDIAQCIERYIERIKPSIVYTHWSGDLNRDHQIVALATLTACRPQPGAPVKEIYSFEVPSATGWGEGQFQPNTYISISREWEQKYDALELYDGELRDEPHARSRQGIAALAEWRGHSVGVDMAEAFVMVRKVEE